MKVAFYGHVRQYENIKAEIDANISEVLMSGKYVMGPMLDKFEKEFAAFTGMKHAIGVGNGTDALWLTMMALGIGPGDEVITHPNTSLPRPRRPGSSARPSFSSTATPRPNASIRS